MKLDQELSNTLKLLSKARLRRARAADLMPKSNKHLSIVQAIFQREHEMVKKLTHRKGRIDQLLTVAKRVERKSQDRKWTR